MIHTKQINDLGLYCGSPLLRDRWNERSSATHDDEHHDEQPVAQPHKRMSAMDYFGACSCAPALALLSDSEDSSQASTCATEEFFDLEDALNAIEHWNKSRRRVRFGKATVREYAITVGDHPVCKDGLALSLDWNHTSEQVYDIDSFERMMTRRNTRKGCRRRRTSRLDYWQRREILQNVGSFSNTELSRIERQRHKDAVSEFLVDAGKGDFGPSEDEFGVELMEEEDGVELLEFELDEGDDDDGDDDVGLNKSYAGFGFELDVAESEWQMKVQVLEG
mmetsp:Transcript_24025/g.39217  ORF Transcript_24025/g.39217 Transcript_24025/m.39217 type:complete len:278 (+) Transcript_24025:230-1063(+)|eukprot:CAMPEP_0178744276 /NCGR_PEP_ID=MMETSP0744-20121128/6679_1 /TAXON_ID=913974 /ORGANISM="Nitzschia punctata, Strain CCMP561" /LENGTH=277 /DNA_ID=CAMNT_0020397389 /DNA_START=171 /DNA_END=1004 /DNA_ORIENTATION=-